MTNFLTWRRNDKPAANIASPRRLNGNMRAVQALLRRSVMGYSSHQNKPILMVAVRTAGPKKAQAKVEPLALAPTSPTLGDCTTCTAICGRGAFMGCALTQTNP